jgi:hypothetical protein
MELLLLALAPFILYALLFDRIVAAADETAAGGREAPMPAEVRVLRSREFRARSRLAPRDRATRSGGAAQWN